MVDVAFVKFRNWQPQIETLSFSYRQKKNDKRFSISMRVKQETGEEQRVGVREGDAVRPKGSVLLER